MRRISAIVFILISINVSGQLTIPDFDSNLTNKDSADYKKYLNNTILDYDIAISLSVRPSFPRDTTINMLLYKKEDRWMQLEIFSNDSFDRNIYKTIKKDTNQQLYDSTWQRLIQNHLFSINYVSLKIRERKLADSTTESFNDYNAIYYTFCIFTKYKQRCFDIPNPEKFLEWMPENPDIKNFIICKDMFLLLWGYGVGDGFDKEKKKK